MADYESWFDPSQFSVAPDLFSGVDFFGGMSEIPYEDYSSWFDPSQFNLNFDPNQYAVPMFDPGQFDLGFDPLFNRDQYFAGIADPYAIPTGNLNLPDFDLSSYLAGQAPPAQDFYPSLNAMGNFNFDSSAITPAFDFGPEPTVNLGEFAPSTDFSFDIGQGGSPLDPSMFGSNVGSGTQFGQYTDPGFGPSLDQSGLAAIRNQPSIDPNYPKAPGTGGNESLDQFNKARADYYKYAPLLGLGQLGLGLSGGLMQAFGPQPTPRKPTDLENARTQAEIDAIRAKIDLEKEALRLKAEQMAMEGGPESQEGIAQLQADTAIRIQEMKNESDKLLAELNRRKPLFTTDPRFSTLYNETVGAQQGLSPDAPEIQQMTQQIYAVRQQAATEQYTRQRDAIIERSNRLGTNPAAELAQINEAEQQAKQAMLVEAQQTALAFAQSRLDPSMALLDAILKTVV